jgi:DNA-directed RNA polymerase specialized sigma subunit
MMGREERRAQERITRQLEKRLRRPPTDEEIAEALRQLELTRQKEGRERLGGAKPKVRPAGWKVS